VPGPKRLQILNAGSQKRTQNGHSRSPYVPGLRRF
jgi:hypothetical protein